MRRSLRPIEPFHPLPGNEPCISRLAAFLFSQPWRSTLQPRAKVFNGYRRYSPPFGCFRRSHNICKLKHYPSPQNNHKINNGKNQCNNRNYESQFLSIHSFHDIMNKEEGIASRPRGFLLGVS
nr:MAG TPA: hypothetical protein [Caudoviricetes sp.]